MTERPHSSVGRTWYVEIRQGTISSQVFFGTRHPATGDSLWHSMSWETPGFQMTEGEVLDEIWAAVLQLMEQRTSIG